MDIDTEKVNSYNPCRMTFDGSIDPGLLRIPAGSGMANGNWFYSSSLRRHEWLAAKL
jgi:hypothetical protein